MHTSNRLAWHGLLFLLLRASTFTHVSPSGHCCFILRPVHGQVHKGYVSVSAPKQTQDNLEAVFAVTEEARKYPFSLGLVGRDERGQACCFPLANFPAGRGGSTEEHSLLPSSPPSPSLLRLLNCRGLVATAGESRKPQLCGTKQACIMFTQ